MVVPGLCNALCATAPPLSRTLAGHCSVSGGIHQMRFIKRLLAACRYWKYRRDFERLSPYWQAVLRLMGDDPDSQRDRGRFE